MSQKVAKRIRKAGKMYAMQALGTLQREPFRVRLGIAWKILFPRGIFGLRSRKRMWPDSRKARLQRDKLNRKKP